MRGWVLSVIVPTRTFVYYWAKLGEVEDATLRKRNPLDVLPNVSKSTVWLAFAANRIVSERLIAENKRANFLVEPRECWVMMAAQDAEVSQTVIAECLGINPNVMVGIVDSLEHKGLIRRRRAENRREYRLELTTTGKHQLQVMFEDWQGRTRRIFEPLTDEEIMSIRDMARRVIEASFEDAQERLDEIEESTSTAHRA